MELTGWDIFTANDESAIGKVVNDAFAQSFNSLLDNNESEKTSVADFFATDNGTVSIGDFQYFDLSGTALDENVDLSVLNIQYASMAENMLDSQIDLTGHQQTQLIYLTIPMATYSRRSRLKNRRYLLTSQLRVW